MSWRRHSLVKSIGSLGMVALGMAANPCYSQSATRTLPVTYVPSEAVAVTIALEVPFEISVVAVEESPPAGWAVANISHSGEVDAVTGEVKWGPFFAPTIPAQLSYDVIPPAEASGQASFFGRVSFNGPEQTIGGDQSVIGPIPAMSAWGALILAASTATAGVVILRRRLCWSSDSCAVEDWQ